MNNKAQRIRGIFAVIAAEVLFGLSFVFTKDATSQASTLELLCWRFLLAAAAFFILIKAGCFKVHFHGKSIKLALLLALFHPVCYFICENQGVSMTSASESGSIIATIPVFALLFSMVFLKIKPLKKQLIGIPVTMVGVLSIVLSQSSQPTFNLAGYLCLFGAVIFYSFFGIWSVRLKEFSSLEKACVMIFSGAAFFSAAALLEAFSGNQINHLLRLPFTNTVFLTAILYLGIGSSVIAFTCNNYSIEVLGASASASFAGISTVVSVLAGVLFLGESYSTWQTLGTVLVIAGVSIANKD